MAAEPEKGGEVEKFAVEPKKSQRGVEKIAGKSGKVGAEPEKVVPEKNPGKNSHS